jgi:hypothetical protein
MLSRSPNGIVEQHSCRLLNEGFGAGDAALDVAVEILAGVVEKALHGPTAVVWVRLAWKSCPARSMRFAAVKYRGRMSSTILPFGRLEDAASRACRVDAMVVDDEVDAPRARSAVLVQQLEELAEQCGALSLGARRVQQPGADVELADQEELLVLAGHDDGALLAGEHPITPDLRVEADVDFGAWVFLVGGSAIPNPRNPIFLSIYE